MENPIKYASYQKLLIFGSEGSGKTSLTKRLEKGSFTEESHSENGKIFFKFYLNNYIYRIHDKSNIDKI